MAHTALTASALRNMLCITLVVLGFVAVLALAVALGAGLFFLGAMVEASDEMCWAA